MSPFFSFSLFLPLSLDTLFPQPSLPNPHESNPYQAAKGPASSSEGQNQLGQPSSCLSRPDQRQKVAKGLGLPSSVLAWPSSMLVRPQRPVVVVTVREGSWVGRGREREREEKKKKEKNNLI